MQAQKILIVEDDAVIARFIQIKLEELGYEVSAKVRTGNEAILTANHNPPDLILMDVMLEGDMDGIETVQEISKTIDVPVVYLTASSDEDTISRLMKTEPHGFLIKPFDDKILASAIHIAVYRHKGKKELFDAKETLRTTLESIDDMVFSLDSSGCFTHNYSGSEHILECFRFQSVEGKAFHDVFPAATAAKLDECLRRVISTGKSDSVEFSVVENDLPWWFFVRFTLRKDPKGTSPAITMVMSDITRSKVIYQELVLSQEKLTEALNTARLGSFDVNLTTQKHLCNPIFFEILDIEDEAEKEKFNEEKLINYIHPDDRNRFRLYMNQVVQEQRTSFTMEYRILDRSQKQRYIHMVGQLKYDDNLQPIRKILTLQDVSWQKSNEKLRQDIELTRKTAEMKQRFYARLSHEIRNPVGGIAGIVHMLEKTTLSAEQKELVSALMTTSDSLFHLVNDVLDYSKIESGMMKVKRNKFLLSEQVKGLYSFYSVKALEKNLRFESFIDPAIPDALMGDERKISQVVSNMLSNAMKFTSKGSVMLRILASETENSRITLKVEVEDTGLGISKEDQESLFREYSQLDNELVEQNIGTGLGLTISKQLVELMGGEIGVNSQKDKGSLFWFTLPLELAEDVAVQAEEPHQKKTTRKVDGSVLLVDDLALNRKILQMMLKEMGCRVTMAENGKQALDLIHEAHINAFNIFGELHYDIIIMDHIMPVMDGVTAAQEIRKRFKNVPPLVLLTADESFAEDDKFRKSGFDDVLIKPVKPEQLQEKVLQWIKAEAAEGQKEKFEIYSREEIDKKPVVNENTLELIIRHAEENHFRVDELFRSFIEDMELIYDQILSAIELNDYNALNLIMLSVKGLSGNIGASQVHATAKLIDRYLRNEAYEDAKELLPLLAEKYSIFKNRIETEYIQNLRTTENP